MVVKKNLNKSYHFLMQWASSTMSACNLSSNIGVFNKLLHFLFNRRDSGVKYINWYFPLDTSAFKVLSSLTSSLIQTDDNPLCKFDCTYINGRQHPDELDWRPSTLQRLNRNQSCIYNNQTYKQRNILDSPLELWVDWEQSPTNNQAASPITYPRQKEDT